MNHKEEIKKWKREYEAATNELREDIKELQKGYEIKIREITSERNKVPEESREKDSQIREKNHQIKESNKGMEIGNATTAQLQEDLNRFKDLYFNLKNEENKAKQKIQQLEWNVQDQSSKASEIGELKKYIQKIEPQMINYRGQIQQLVDELNQTKQNAIIERNEILEASRRELMEHADAEHSRILAEKDEETQGLKQKYSELENQFNELKSDYENVGELFDKLYRPGTPTKLLKSPKLPKEDPLNYIFPESASSQGS